MALRIRPRTPDDDARIVEMRNAINHDRSPLSVEELRHRIAVQPANAVYEHVVAEMDTYVVGEARFNREIHLKDTGSFRASITVDREMWHRGIGSGLWSHLLHRARERGVTRMVTTIREDLPRAQEFAQRRAFHPSGRIHRISRLDVASANLDRCRRGAVTVEEAGIRIATLAELGPDDETLLRAIHQVDEESARDMPSSAEWGSIPFEQWRTETMEDPSVSPDAFWIALDGEQPVGLAVLDLRSDGNAGNAYTGVSRRYRGRGVARALKLRTVEWAAQQGVPYIYTGNDVANEAMLAINIDLGYQPLPAIIEFVRASF